jgi:hypothetical protein
MGRLAYRTAANMLTRFCGKLELSIEGTRSPEITGWLAELAERLRAIDSRASKRIEFCDTTDSEASVSLAVGPVDSTAKVEIAITFSAWTATVGEGSLIPAPTESGVPFGALIASCFGVAEVFKAVLQELPEENARAFAHRRVRDFTFDAWSADVGRLGAVEGPESLQSLSCSSLLQVGAGAVGNASMLALSELTGIEGPIPLCDRKVVDDRNLNRCLLFSEDDVDDPKVEVVARAMPDGLVHPIEGDFEIFLGERASVLLSTVDNNEVRHQMQECIPRFLIQGSTGGTVACVSVHTAVDGLSCIVCRHPDREGGLSRRQQLPVEEAARRLGVPKEVIRDSRFEGSTELNEGFLNTLAEDPELQAFFTQKQADGVDLCGALADFRTQHGIDVAPQEPSVPFVSAFAGFQAAAEAVKALLRGQGTDAPLLRNVLQIDLARRYSRDSQLSFAEPASSSCQLCGQRADLVAAAYHGKWGASCGALQ